MRRANNFLAAAVAAACLVLAACGANGVSDLQGFASGNTSAAATLKSAVPGASSPDGTTIPSATQIIDGNGNVWTVSGGIVYVNGALASYTADVTLLLYENNTVYQENASGGWWSWNGTGWTASSNPPAATSSPNGTTIPSATQIIDGNGNLWTVSAGVVYVNGALASYTADVTLLLYENNAVYQENASGGWWSWNGGGWTAGTDPLGGSAAPAPTLSGSPPASDVAGDSYSFVPTTTNPGGGTLSFSITNMPAWASFSTLTGALTGTPGVAQAGVYASILISASNGSASASLTPFSITVTTGSASLSWTAPMQNTDGTPLTDLAGFTIYYGASADALTQTVQLTDPTATSYVVSNLSAGTYYFAIAAYSTEGLQSAQSTQAAKTIM